MPAVCELTQTKSHRKGGTEGRKKSSLSHVKKTLEIAFDEHEQEMKSAWLPKAQARSAPRNREGRKPGSVDHMFDLFF
jgi:hypothetical protein